MTTDAFAPPPAPDPSAPLDPADPGGLPPLPGVDGSTPSPARMYDYFLGGTSNYPCDRVVGDQVRATIPEVVDAAWANRAFHQRAARWIAESGVRQFIDIGSGLPTAGNTHQIVQKPATDAHVVYVDHDPLVESWSTSLLAGQPGCAAIRADLRDPDSLLGHPDLRALIDLREPVGLLMTAVIHFVAVESDPWELVARYVAALAPGSYLALSHVTDEKTPARSVRMAEEMYARATERIYFRSRADIERFFDGMEFGSPCPNQHTGVVHVGEWGAEDPELADSDGSRWLFGGVGRRPSVTPRAAADGANAEGTPTSGSTPESVPPGVDLSRPSPARLYDYFLGGTHNYEVDRVAADRLRERVPELPDMAWANRGFHQRAARWLAAQGIRQFIDVGSGLPTIGNTHEVVRKVAPTARVVYVDIDPMVAACAGELVDEPDLTRVVVADLRQPAAVLGHQDVRALIDFDAPAALLMTAVLHFVADEDDPWGLVRTYLDALAPGSYLALSHGTSDKTPPSSVASTLEMFATSSEHGHARTLAQIERFFEGLELVPPREGARPAVVHVGEWGAEDLTLADSDGSRWSYCGVALHR